jgi:O-antigen/teichoic acid export membrane protein
VKKLLSQYQNLNIGVKSAFWYAFSNVFQKFVVFFCTPIFTRCLTTVQYGQYQVYNSWYAIIMVFATLNMFYSGYTAGITKYEDDSADFTMAMVGLCVVISALVGSIFLCIQYRYHVIDIETKYCYAMMCEIIGFAFFNFWASFQRFYYKYRSLVMITIAMSVCIAVGSVIAVIILPEEMKLGAKIYIESCAWFLAGIVCLCKILKKSVTLYKIKYWKFGIKNNLPLIPHYLSGTILSHSDRIMIASLEGTEQVGLYSLAYSMAMFLTAVSTAIQNAFNPYLYRKLKSKDVGKVYSVTKVLIAFFAIICCLIALIAPEAIKIIAPEQYWEAVYVMAPVICSVYFIFLNMLFSSIEHFFGKTFCVSTASCVGAVLNIILNYIFIPKYGYVAAGYTTLICYCLLALLNMIFSEKIIHKNQMREYYDKKYVCLISILVIAATVIIVFLYQYMIRRYLIVLFIVIYLITQKKKIMYLVSVIGTKD